MRVLYINNIFIYVQLFLEKKFIIMFILKKIKQDLG